MITVKIDDTAVMARLASAPARLQGAVSRFVRRFGFEFERFVKQNKLSGQVLKVRSNTLRSSINTSFSESPSEVSATTGTNVSYGKIQEYGVDHSWQIPKTPLPKGRALMFQIGGQTIFRRQVTHPPLAAHSFLRSALADKTPAFETGIEGAVGEELRR